MSATAVGPSDAEWAMVDWTTPAHSKGEVRRAGKTLIADKPPLPDYFHAMNVVQNWRSSHSYPLQSVLMLLRGNAHRIDPGADVVRRIKRLISIEAKLRNTNLDLTQIQDLGGCR